MSKIQKALKALSQSKSDQKAGKPAPTRASGHLVRELESTIGARDRRKTASPDNHGTHQLTRSDDFVEVIPGHEIEVQNKALEAVGLLPQQGDLAEIGQQFRQIKRPIIRFAFDNELSVSENSNVVMMASALPGAGKTFCAFNLAQSVALERDIGAILVDADVLKPGISRSLGLQDHVGLIDYLMDESIPLEDILVQTNLNGVIVVPAGRKHPESTELLASRRMGNLVKLLAERFGSRVVIFDTPPLLLTNEAQELAAQSGQIVLVIEARVSTQDSVSRALALLDRQKPVNAILNKSRSANGNRYQGGNYGYYAYGDAGDRDENSA